MTKPSGVVEHKHTIMAGGEVIAVNTLSSNSVNDTCYLHNDQLGSGAGVTGHQVMV